MKFTTLISASLMSLLLSACASSSLDSSNTTINNRSDLKTTLSATSSKIPEVFTQCVYAQLQVHYPSAGLRKKAVNLYEGYVPGVDRNTPRAIYDVHSTTDDVLANVTLKQVEPVDDLLLDIFKSCL